MALEKLAEVISTDVLILGGGISGLCAAIKAKEKNVDVLVVDKGGIGWAGHVPIGGGFIACQLRGGTPKKEFVKWIVEKGHYLNNQDWTNKIVNNIQRDLKEMDDLGFPFYKANGEISISASPWEYDITHVRPEKSMVKLKQAALKRGVKTIDRVYMIDLLSHDGKIAGAIGFGVVDGKAYIVNAKAVVIASSSCRFKRAERFCGNAGEGPAMAYRAGAQLINAEFGGAYVFGFKGLPLFQRGFWCLFFENALGENLAEKYYPESFVGEKTGQEKISEWQIANALYNEVQAGRGPIYLDMSKLTPKQKQIVYRPGVRPLFSDFYKVFKEKVGKDPNSDKFEVQPVFTAGQGPIRVDLDCRTTLDRLWTVGDAGSLGSSWVGARASSSLPAMSLTFAVVSGFAGGKSAGMYAASNPRIEIGDEEVKRIKERIFLPLSRSSDTVLNEVIYKIHEAIVPMKYNFRREKKRLKDALGILNKARERLEVMGVKDYHSLMRYHQTESMLLAAEWTLSAALKREESRGTHYREDYPNIDNKNWLKWVTIKQECGVPLMWTENVPIETYEIRP
jgi:succinate dehydrogenase/fumarate reductase flavoprotein subunit